MNPKGVDRFLDRAKNGKEEMKLLRKICLDCGLDEDFKWIHRGNDMFPAGLNGQVGPNQLF